MFWKVWELEFLKSWVEFNSDVIWYWAFIFLYWGVFFYCCFNPCLITGLFRFSMSSWISLGRLCVQKSVHFPFVGIWLFVVIFGHSLCTCGIYYHISLFIFSIMGWVFFWLVGPMVYWVFGFGFLFLCVFSLQNELFNSPILFALFCFPL